MKKSEEIKFWKKAIKILKEGYGADCKTSDLDDFRKMYTNKKYKMHEMITSDARCASCRAKETIKFIESVVGLLEMEWE